jgi:hypothetical protein
MKSPTTRRPLASAGSAKKKVSSRTLPPPYPPLPGELSAFRSPPSCAPFVCAVSNVSGGAHPSELEHGPKQTHPPPPHQIRRVVPKRIPPPPKLRFPSAPTPPPPTLWANEFVACGGRSPCGRSGTSIWPLRP